MITKIKRSLEEREDGFTLLEIMLAVVIISALASTVIMAINPGKQLMATRDAQRKTDINVLYASLHQYSVDNNGHFP